MFATNLFDSFTAPAIAFFPEPTPTREENDSDEDYGNKLTKYEEAKKSFMELMDVNSLNDNAVLKFSLGSIVFDFINSAVQQKVYATPESPKLLKRMEKQFTDYAMISDNDGEIEVPDSWIPYVDKIFTDDSLFANVALHGEIIGRSGEKTGKTLPVRGRVLMAMPKINQALLNILPE